MEKKVSNFKKLLPLLVQSFIGIALMYILWLIMTNLPMLAGIPFSLRFSLYSLVGAPILLIIVGMIIHFSLRMDNRLNYFYPGFPYWGQLVKNAGFLIGVLISYLALRPLLVPYMGNYGWIFHALFLAGFVAFLGILIYLIVNVLQKVFPLIWSGKISELGSGDLCVKCSMVLKPGAKFCPACGTKTGGPAPNHPEPHLCSYCKKPLLQGALFCPGCGTPAGLNAATESAATVNLGQEVCISCKAALKSGSMFCPHCGSRQQ